MFFDFILNFIENLFIFTNLLREKQIVQSILIKKIINIPGDKINIYIKKQKKILTISCKWK